KVSLPGLPRAAGQMVDREEQSGPGRGESAPGRRQRRRGQRGGREAGEVEDAPARVAGAEEPERKRVEQVDAWEVHVEEVAMGSRAVSDAPGDVVNQRGVVDQGPAARAPCQSAREARQRDDDGRAENRRALQRREVGSTSRETPDRGSPG